jgi:hypothetical protein
MSLRLFLAAPGNILLEFDDPGTPDDAGVPIVAFAESHAFDVGRADGERRLRDVVQWVAIGDASTVTIEPIMDDARRADQATVFALDVTRGQTQRLEASVSVMGRRFGARITAVGGLAVALGQAALSVVPRRSQTGG